MNVKDELEYEFASTLLVEKKYTRKIDVQNSRALNGFFPANGGIRLFIQIRGRSL